MTTSRLLITAASSLTLIGASSLAFAQSTPPDRPTYGAPNQNLNQGQSSDRPSSTTMPGSTNSTTQRQFDSTTGNDTTGSRMGRSTDDTMRQSSDGSTTRSERLARADRN